MTLETYPEGSLAACGKAGDLIRYDLEGTGRQKRGKYIKMVRHR
jgi:hypothetical protein